MLFDFVHGTFHMRVQRVGVVLQRGAAARRFGGMDCAGLYMGVCDYVTRLLHFGSVRTFDFGAVSEDSVEKAKDSLET
jgi:hypothetical protein